MLVALIVSTNYALFAFSNVKLMDMLVFLAGFWMGPLYGAAAGALSWSVYGTVNPLGFSLLTFATVVPMEMLYGILGGVLRRRAAVSPLEMSWAFGLVGLGGTLAYDLVTNAMTGVISSTPILATMFNPLTLAFSAAHIVSNVLLFSLLAPVIVVETRKSFFRGMANPV
jgi:hypothetical protein